MTLALLGAVSQGILWGIMVLGVYITYKLLDIADLTCDGSLALGGCICAVLVVEHEANPWLALLAGTIAGMLGTIASLIAPRWWYRWNLLKRKNEDEEDEEACLDSAD